MRLALLVEASLAESIGTMRAFLGNTVPEEYRFWIGPRDQMRNRSDAFKKDAIQEQAGALCEGVEGYVAILETICGNGNTAD